MLINVSISPSLAVALEGFSGYLDYGRCWSTGVANDDRGHRVIDRGQSMSFNCCLNLTCVRLKRVPHHRRYDKDDKDLEVFTRGLRLYALLVIIHGNPTE